ncbi:MAG: cobalamin B12-binding domain-containing protein [Bacillota bacterium]
MSKKEIKDFIINNREDLIEKIMEEQFQLMPELKEKYNETQIRKSKSDTSYNLNYLAQAVFADEVNIFSNYYRWLYTVLKERGMKDEILKTHLTAIKNVLEKKLDKNNVAIITKYLNAADESLNFSKNYYDSFINEDNFLHKEADKYLDFLINMEREKAVSFILNLVDNNTLIEDIYLKIFQPTQYEIGRLWQLNQISIAQEHYATSVTQLTMSQLYPKIFTSFKKGKKALTTCIGDELHELGIRMVADLLELNGWDTIHLGSNTPAAEILNLLEEKEIDLLALSVTLPNQLEKTRNLITAVHKNEKLSKLKIMVGGRIFMQNNYLWQKIGADGFAIDAKEAVKVADSLL